MADKKKVTDQVYDRRVIVLSKLMRNAKAKEYYPDLGVKKNENGECSWLTLGYFDSMDIYALPESVSPGVKGYWDESVRLSSKLDGTAYFHQLNIIRSVEESSPSENFWKKESEFMFVSLVHASSCIEFPENGEPASSHSAFSLSTLVSGILDKTQRKLKQKNLEFDFTIYHSLDLSDIIILWKTAHLQPVLEAIDVLIDSKCVGSIHTLCGIEKKLLEEASFEHHEQEEISFCNIRLTVRSKTGLLSVADSISSITGMQFDKHMLLGYDDANINLNGMCVSKLLELMKFWTTEEGMLLFAENVFDVATQIGYKTKGAIHCHSSGSDAITTRFRAILDVLENEENAEALCHSWVRALRELVNRLVDMSRTCVFDEICFTVYPAVVMFVEKIKVIINSNKQNGDMKFLFAGYRESVEKFIRGLSLLLDQAARTDGQFIQSQLHNPLVANIPVGLFEYYMAFIRMATKYMCRTDGKNGTDEKEYAFLLVPKLCRRIKTVKSINKEPKDASVMYSEIPISQVYEPKSVLVALTHEAAHYAGEDTRLRDQRFVCFCVCVAAHLCDILGYSGNKIIINCIASTLLRNHPKSEQNYMNEIIDRLMNSIFEHIMTDDYMEYLSQQIERSEEVGTRKTRKKRKILNGDSDKTLIIKYMYELRELINDCYADAQMLFMLRPTVNEHLSYFEYERDMVNETDYLGKWFRLTLQRLVILYAAWQDVMTDWNSTDRVHDGEGMKIDPDLSRIDVSDNKTNELAGIIYDKIKDCEEAMTSEPGNESLVIRLVIFKNIKLYITNCLKKMLSKEIDTVEMNNDTAQYASYSSFAKQFRSIDQEGFICGEDYYKFIHKYRCEIMHEAK